MPSNGSLHIVLFPFPAQGHFAAFISLGTLLHRAQPSADITLVSTESNVAALRSTAAPFLRFHSLPFVPADHGLPAGGESTGAVPVHHFITLFEASESLHAGFDSFVRGACTGAAAVRVVADPFFAWTTAVARRHGAAHALFASCGAFGSAVYHSTWNHLPHLCAPAGDDTFLLPDHPEVAVHRSQLQRNLLDADGTDRSSRFIRRQISHGHGTGALLVNTVEELEPAGLRMLRKTMGDVPVWPIGPVVRAVTQRAAADEDDDVMRWLDAHAPCSVLYVSFGSQFTIRAAQMVELASALESTGRPFIWAVRPPVGELPEAFQESSRGLLLRRWAPQVRILAHASTGAFLSHCGWNSVLESLTHGVPILGWPLGAEQFHNSRALEEELGVSVEVARGNLETSGLDKSKVTEAVETVIGTTAKGHEMRRRVMEIQQLIGRAQEDGGSSVKALEGFFALTPLSRCHTE